MNDYQIMAIADNIANQVNEIMHAVNVEDIQDMVETGIMEYARYEVAQKYVRYRYKRRIESKIQYNGQWNFCLLIEHTTEEVNQEKLQ